MSFFATVAYELSPETSPEARKMLRAELVGRRYQDRLGGRLLPANVVWIKRSTKPGETVDHLRELCSVELREAVAAVSARALPIRLVRGWVQVTGAGTYGLVDADASPPSGRQGGGENV